jgi:ParG
VTKTVPFKMPARHPDPADAWVQTRAAEPEIPAPMPTEAMKRFTSDVPVSLHTRIKAQCALRSEKMADVIRELLDREFPKP